MLEGFGGGGARNRRSRSGSYGGLDEHAHRSHYYSGGLFGAPGMGGFFGGGPMFGGYSFGEGYEEGYEEGLEEGFEGDFGGGDFGGGDF